ncbi:MAG: hypothetical protein QM535_18855 [Limnohabitans sp.]|nr:hypothetical protein [Limnohabitans sp.]
MTTTSLNVEQVINRYSKEYSVSLEQSERHFHALFDFLKLAATSDKPCFPDKTIDNAWHTFIIHTKLYSTYCSNQFKKFIHHNPIDKIEQPIEGYLCSFDSDTNSLFYKLTPVTQAVCDGGGGNCSSCASVDPSSDN